MHFSLWLENQSNQLLVENEFYKIIVDMVQRMSHKSPFAAFLLQNKEEFQEFLMSARYILKSMTQDEQERTIKSLSSGEGLGEFFKMMVKDYESRSPEVKVKDVQKAYDDKWDVKKQNDIKNRLKPGEVINPNHTASGRKILELAMAVASKYKIDHNTLLQKISNLMTHNGQDKVDQWADQISNVDEMEEKIRSWQSRGLI